MSSRAVSEAAALLRCRLGEATAEVEAKTEAVRLKNDEVRVLNDELGELTSEVQGIKNALQMLDPLAAIYPAPFTEAPRVSVRSYVQDILEGAYQFWSSTDLVARIEDDIAKDLINIQVNSLPSSVRSALWNLVNDGLARRRADDKVVAAKWEPNTIPTPAGPRPSEEEVQAS